MPERFYAIIAFVLATVPRAAGDFATERHFTKALATPGDVSFATVTGGRQRCASPATLPRRNSASALAASRRRQHFSATRADGSAARIGARRGRIDIANAGYHNSAETASLFEKARHGEAPPLSSRAMPRSMGEGLGYVICNMPTARYRAIRAMGQGRHFASWRLSAPRRARRLMNAIRRETMASRRCRHAGRPAMIMLGKIMRVTRWPFMSIHPAPTAIYYTTVT